MPVLPGAGERRPPVRTAGPIEGGDGGVVSQDENPGEWAAAGERAVPTEAAVSEAAVSEAAVSTDVLAGEAAAVSDAPVAASAVASVLRELETLPERELAEHPDTYQRIHAGLQAALATIDNA